MKITPLLPSSIGEEAIWKALFEVADEVSHETVAERIRKFKNRHNIDQLVQYERDQLTSLQFDSNDETTQLITTFANLLGYAYKDGGKLQPDEYLRFVESATQFNSEKGISTFLDYFSYLINRDFESVVLWYDPVTKTYHNEDDAAIAGRRVVLDGTDASFDCYPTPYIEIKFDANTLTDYETNDLLKLLYSVAPIDVVVKDIVLSLTGNLSIIYIQNQDITRVVEHADYEHEVLTLYYATDGRIAERGPYIYEVERGVNMTPLPTIRVIEESEIDPNDG